MKNNGEGTPLTHPASGATPLDTPTYRISADCPPKTEQIRGVVRGSGAATAEPKHRPLALAQGAIEWVRAKRLFSGRLQTLFYLGAAVQQFHLFERWVLMLNDQTAAVRIERVIHEKAFFEVFMIVPRDQHDPLG